MEARTKELLMYALGAFVVLCAVVVLVLLVYREIPPGNRDMVTIALGALLGMAVNVVGYFYGSSRSSTEKDRILQATTTQLLERPQTLPEAPRRA